MSPIPHIKKSDVTRWTDQTYFQRGQKYYEQGSIYEQRQQGMTLKSKCSGSQAPFYRQEVLLDTKGVISAECSCPVGTGGHCKHTVALLLTWVNDPDSFEEVEVLDAILEKRSKPELIAIIRLMLEQEPDLESLLKLQLGGDESQPLNIKALRQQAERAFRGVDYYEWGYTREIAQELNPLLKLAENYQTRNDPENSAAIYRAIIETILENTDAALGDEDGRLLGVMDDCAEALGKCLTIINEPKTRSEILQILFSAYRWDTINAGGVGAADCVPGILVIQTTAKERTEIAKWIRNILPKGDSWSDGYHREVLGGFLLDLEADKLDDEAYLNLCRQTGRLNDLIERLLKLRRVKEAEDAAKAAEDYPLFKTLEVFVKFKQDDLAEKIIMERLDVPINKDRETDDRLVEWLAQRFKERGDFAGSLNLEERIFWKHPNIEGYKKLRDLAKKLNHWDDLRCQIIAKVGDKKNVEFLIRIYLLDKEVGNAIATLDKLPTRWGGSAVQIEVAQAAKKQYPHESINIFMKEAQRFIDQRNRGSYSEAALFLREIRDIYHDLKDMDSWSKLIADIRGRHKNLPALQDELNQLKL